MKRSVLVLQDMQSLGQDYVLFRFEMPSDIEFEEGQYGVFLHVDKDVEGRRMRAFSFASKRGSNHLDIATRITEEPSDFKRLMKNLQIGDIMTVDGPMGNFTYRKDTPSVFIAGGIGITPIRSILQAHHTEEKPLHLIYSERDGFYPFKEELDQYPDVSKVYVSGIEPTKEAIKNAVNTYPKATYYLAGSAGFISGIKDMLTNLSIPSEQIVFDRFSGYEESEL